MSNEKKKNGNRYSDDFRKMIIDLYHSGQQVSDLSSEYDVSEVTIYSWIKKFTPMDMEDGFSVTPDDYTEIQKQMLSLKEKNEILENYDHIRQKVNDTEIKDFIKKKIILFKQCMM